MTDIDVLIEKINNIQNCLARIHDTIKGDVNRLENLDAQDIVTLNLQRAVQLVVDIATHIVSTENLGVPQSLKDVFVILEKNKILDSNLSLKMQKMVGFRNIAVHDYQAINPAVIKSILTSHLNDFEDFYTAVLQDKETEPKDYSSSSLKR